MPNSPPIHHNLSLLTVLRVFKSYLRHPLRTFLKIERNDWGKYKAYRKLRSLGYTDYFSNAVMPTGAHPPDWADLLNIYELVRQLKPSVVLEIGGGCSTLIFLQALYDNEVEDPQNRTARLHTLDESEYWLSKTMEYVPPHLSTYLHANVCTPELITIDSVSVSVVGDIPVGKVDLLYIDGGLFEDNQIGADTLVIEQSAAEPLTILVDGRKPTVEYLRSNLKRKYNIKANNIHHWTIFQSI